jgi:hypothetical protein
VIVDVEEQDKLPVNDMAELLMLHYQYGHISMRKLQKMAKQAAGHNTQMRTIQVQDTNLFCMLVLQSNKETMEKQDDQDRSGRQYVTPRKAGQVVSVDQLVSPTTTPELIAQSDVGLPNNEKIQICDGICRPVQSIWIYILTEDGDRTGNSRRQAFKAHEWIDSCKKEGQGLTFAGVNAHHRNGVAKRRIRELQELDRKRMLIHANKRWADSVTANLWPYAMRMAQEAINNTPSLHDSKERRSPIELFSGTNKVVSNPKHWKPFGCPVNVLENDLQSNIPFHKWNKRSKVGIYLGMSLIHNSNVALVLERNTAHVSPSFHVKFDAAFDTVKQISSKSMWQVIAGFVSQREKNK